MIFTLTLNPALDKTILVDSLEFNGVNRPIDIYCESGGKGFNVSRALVRLGIQNCAIGFVGGGIGEFIQTDLENQGIETDFLCLAEETRTNLVIREVNGRYIKINEYGPKITPEAASQLLAQVDRLANKGDLWALCGSLPPGLTTNYYQQIINLLHLKGVFVAVDTSGSALHFALQAKPELVKPNQFEAWEILREEISIKEIPSAFHGMGVSKVGLSLGEDGLLYSDENYMVSIKLPKLTAVNPVGAGDATLAGMLYGIVSRSNPIDIAKWGAASGSAAAVSATNCFSSIADVESIFKKLLVEEL